MGISLKSQKMLWGRASALCSFPNCHRELIVNATEDDKESLVGEVCHIIAKKPSEPRGDSLVSPEQLDDYSNLILLCREHHKLVDDQINSYTVQCLLEMKTSHENRVRESHQKFDPEKQRDGEIFAEYIDEWIARADLDNWQAWSSYILSTQPSMLSSRDKEVEELRIWLLSRLWPNRYPELKAAFDNFRNVLQDFQNTFRKHAKEVEEDEKELMTEKFYQIEEWDPPRYERLGKKYDFHVALIQDLILELTRAANYICDMVRMFISPAFRLQHGSILVVSGPYIDLTIKKYRVEYKGKERVLFPYPGLERFKRERKDRDVHFGEGTSIDDSEFKVSDD